MAPTSAMRTPGRSIGSSLRRSWAAAVLRVHAAACEMIVVLLFWPLPRGNLLLGDAADLLPLGRGHCTA